MVRLANGNARTFSVGISRLSRHFLRDPVNPFRRTGGSINRKESFSLHIAQHPVETQMLAPPHDPSRRSYGCSQGYHKRTIRQSLIQPRASQPRAPTGLRKHLHPYERRSPAHSAVSAPVLAHRIPNPRQSGDSYAPGGNTVVTAKPEFTKKGIFVVNELSVGSTHRPARCPELEKHRGATLTSYRASSGHHTADDEPAALDSHELACAIPLGIQLSSSTAQPSKGAVQDEHPIATVHCGNLPRGPPGTAAESRWSTTPSTPSPHQRSERVDVRPRRSHHRLPLRPAHNISCLGPLRTPTRPPRRNDRGHQHRRPPTPATATSTEIPRKASSPR